ncbi:MAG TPA: outer membrane beta-barrel protein, partial [Burkholderiales bacterium]|nr:outer membrane beta-barrel protein [Burkholderiales bacterium]
MLAGLISVPAVALADNGVSIPTLSQILDASGISLTGYFDVAYNSLNSTGLFINSAPGPIVGGVSGNTHIFDTPGATQGKDYSAFNIQQFAVIIAKQPKEGFGGYVNMTAGQDAATMASMGFGAPSNVNDSTHTFDITQAYGSYAAGSLTVIAGKFATLAGEELITSPSNFNYTRTWMFGWGPFTHTGVRATYVVNSIVTLIAGVNNGFDQVNSQTNGKTGEFAIDLTPNSIFS